MYNPAGGTSEEYLEIINISPADTIELTGVKFTAGIAFEFPVGAALPPGGRMLIVEDLAAFEATYGAGHPVVGQYAGKLDNGGEQLVLVAADGSIIRDFAYGDDGAWPRSADGQGDSLVLIAPEAEPTMLTRSAGAPASVLGGRQVRAMRPSSMVSRATTRMRIRSQPCWNMPSDRPMASRIAVCCRESKSSLRRASEWGIPTWCSPTPEPGRGRPDLHGRDLVGSARLGQRAG